MLNFLNLLEDDKPRLSWTKIGLVASTLTSLATSIGQMLAVLPPSTALTVGVVATNIAAMAKHEVKRWQTS